MLVNVNTFNVGEGLLPVTCVSRNHQGRRGTTADIGDNLLPSLTVLGCCLTAVEIETDGCLYFIAHYCIGDVGFV